MTSRFQRFAREIKQARKQKKDRETLDMTADGFIFTRRKASDTVRWDDVTKISAGTHAMISGEVFFFLIAAKGVELEVDEFVEGFNGFEQVLLDRFPAIHEKATALQMNASRHERLEVVWTAGAAQ